MKDFLSIAGMFESQYLNVFNTGNTALNKQNIPFQKTSSSISSITKTTLALLATVSKAAPCIVALSIQPQQLMHSIEPCFKACTSSL